MKLENQILATNSHLRSASDLRNGFTLVEVLIVVGIMALLMAVSIPFGVNFYKNQQLNAVSQRVIQVFREAQLKAMSGEASSDFGVYIDEPANTVFLFEGSGFNDGEIRQDFSVPKSVDFDGYSEVVFSFINGFPDTVGDLKINSGKENVIININDVGKIELEQQSK